MSASCGIIQGEPQGPTGKSHFHSTSQSPCPASAAGCSKKSCALAAQLAVNAVLVHCFASPDDPRSWTKLAYRMEVRSFGPCGIAQAISVTLPTLSPHLMKLCWLLGELRNAECIICRNGSILGLHNCRTLSSSVGQRALD